MMNGDEKPAAGEDKFAPKTGSSVVSAFDAFRKFPILLPMPPCALTLV